MQFTKPISLSLEEEFGKVNVLYKLCGRQLVQSVSNYTSSVCCPICLYVKMDLSRRKCEQLLILYWSSFEVDRCRACTGKHRHTVTPTSGPHATSLNGLLVAAWQFSTNFSIPVLGYLFFLSGQRKDWSSYWSTFSKHIRYWHQMCFMHTIRSLDV